RRLPLPCPLLVHGGAGCCRCLRRWWTQPRYAASGRDPPEAGGVNAFLAAGGGRGLHSLSWSAADRRRIAEKARAVGLKAFENERAVSRFGRRVKSGVRRAASLRSALLGRKRIL